MMRLGWFVLGLACVIGAAGCRQMPLRERVPGIGAEKPAAQDDKLASQLSLGRLSERHGQTQYAQQIYEAILRQHPDNPAAHHRLAVVAAQHQEFEKAERHFQQALELGDRNSALLADLGYYFYLRDQLAEAEGALRESLRADPRQKEARTNLGLVLGQQQRFEEAFAEFNKALSDAESHANMGYVYALAGELDLAEKEFHQALSLDSTLRPAAQALLQLQERRQAALVAARDANTTDNARNQQPDASLVSAAAPPEGPRQAVRQAGAEMPVTEEPSGSGEREHLAVSRFERPPSLAETRPPAKQTSRSRKTVATISDDAPGDASRSSGTEAGELSGQSGQASRATATNRATTTNASGSRKTHPWQQPTWSADR